MPIRQQDDDLAREIASSFAAIGDVKAVALARPTVIGFDDEHSDLDFYVYSDRAIRDQIWNAVSRGDDVGVNHRVAAFLASYFDIVFVVNEVLCPGEKNLLRYATDACRRLPDGFDREITGLIHCPNREKAVHLENLLRNLLKILYPDVRKTSTRAKFDLPDFFLFRVNAAILTA